jgi:hypothetical protein
MGDTPSSSHEKSREYAREMYSSPKWYYISKGNISRFALDCVDRCILLLYQKWENSVITVALMWSSNCRHL